MNIVSGLLVKNEASRYLQWTVPNHLSAAMRIVALDDGSADGSSDMLRSFGDRVKVHRNNESEFFAHEGRIRNRLMELVLASGPTAILCLDSDEFLSNPDAVTAAVQTSRQGELMAWTLPMQEIWKADENALWIRSDGGWKQHHVPVLYTVPGRAHAKFQINNKALACGRQPQVINQLALARKAKPIDCEILHFGWTCEKDRQERYDRYAVHDGGRFHANQHIRSIMWPDNRVRLTRREWPESMLQWKQAILERVNR